MSNLKVLPPAFKSSSELKYGVIYVFSNLYVPQDLIDNYFTIMGRVSGQVEALARFGREIHYVEEPPMLVARRFNAGNIGHEAFLSCPVCGDVAIDGQLVEEFVRQLFDFGQVDTGDCNMDVRQMLSRQELTRMRRSIERPDLNEKLEHARERAQEEGEVKIALIDDLRDAEGRELAQAERMRNQFLVVIGQLVLNYVSLTHDDPRQLLGETLAGTMPLIFAPQELSSLQFDGNLSLFLPQYKNAEIRLHPLSKAIYILFLLHPEGIELRSIDRYRDELEQIYDIVMPNRDIDAGRDIIDNVLNPATGTLQQNLSRIKRFFRTVIMDDEVAAKYYITGHRGAPYGIALPRNLVRLPRVFDGIG